MSVVCLDWETAHLYGNAWISHHQLRYRVFAERRRWDVPTYHDLEYDEFDTPAAKYLVWLDATGLARGVTRLIPTTRPYMVKTLWPELVTGTLPSSPSIWEATRFGCDHSLEPAARRRVVAEMICACQEFGITSGIQAYLGVMPLSIFRRVIAAAGCPLEILGPVRDVDGHPTAAAYLHVSEDVLANIRDRLGRRHRVLCAQANAIA